ncbi:hypothetical protein AMELA_G00224260 [Ameiurus melas]|uniref:Orofacial cleft 1 candidate gene 1 protein n=1 Tax=Ameiurus melas TaxID=219545 RepID=A0A7J5ZZ43_AMEME|nr:hypothetical protein AMELA_G00224260 [Ameiurus melas]
MDIFGSKLEQKALKQAKQKKSKSAEFLMAKQQEQEEEESGIKKGIVNPVFLSGEVEDEQSCSRQRDGGREIGGDGQDSTLDAHQQQTKLEALASTRGNEGVQNYFDPWATAEGDLKQGGMSRVGAGDELELKFVHEDERGLYEEISQMLNEDEASTVIDLPGSFGEERLVAVVSRVPQAGWRDQLREKLEEEREEVIPHYVGQLREHVQDDMIPVGRASLEQVKDGCMAEEKEWARKQRVMAILRGNTKESYPIRDMEQKEAALQDRLYAAFQRSERHLLNSLRQHQAEVIGKYGEITEITEPLSIGSELPWQVEWTRTPQPMEVCVVCLRAVREKLSRGLYSVRVSLHSGLGSPALCWSGLKEQQWTGVTEPVEHHGRICDIELHINQNLHVVLPASCDLLPSTVLMFRLLSMPNKQCAVSAVVAWGVFPVCDCSLTLIQGRFRTPLLRSCPNSAIDQFSKIEQLLSADLDNWLCNLYFQVRKLQQRDQRVPEGNANEGTNEEPRPAICTSTCSSTSLTGKSPVGSLPVLGMASQKAKPGTQTKKQPFNKITSQSDCGRERDLQTSIITEELQHFSFSLQSQRAAPRYSVVCCGPAERLCMVWRMLPVELGLSGNPRPSFGQVTLLLTLIFLTWFPRLYLHYCSQWLYLHARNIPVNRFCFHAHTVDLVYQSSLLCTLEELLLVLLGPLTLNAAMFLLLLIRWLCQLVFGSTPSFLSKLIMALGVWTVLDPLAVFIVDAVLGHLSYSAEKPVADAAKLYWHFHHLEQSGTAGILITLFLYTVLFIVSFTMLYIYFLR